MLAWLIAVAVFAAMVSTVVTRWSDELRREKEQELLRVGNQIAGAIASYCRASAGSASKYPPQLEDLLEDRRAFGTLRHLRQIYPDPLSRGAEWGLVRAADGGVMGVYSRSDGVPMRQLAVQLSNVDLAAAGRYADWQFIPREERK